MAGRCLAAYARGEVRARVERCVRAGKGPRRVLTLFSTIRMQRAREEKTYVGRGGSASPGDRAGEGERRAKCAAPRALASGFEEWVLRRQVSIEN